MKTAFHCLVMMLVLATVTGCDEEDKKAAQQKINNLQRELEQSKSEASVLRSEVKAKSTSIIALEHQVISTKESRYSWTIIASVVFLIIGVTLAAKTHRKFKQQWYTQEATGDAKVNTSVR